MKILKNLLKFILGLVLLLAIVGVFLPSQVSMERSIVIGASPDRVFPFVNDLRVFNRWSPWAKLDPETVYNFEGSATGSGAKMSWSSESADVGKGSLTITKSIVNERVDTALDFGDQGMGQASRLLVLQPDNTTRVTWTFSTDFGWNILGRYMGLMFDSMLGPAYEEGLGNLKQLVESNP